MTATVDYTSCTARPHAPVDGVCDRCGTALTGRQKRWCGPRCTRQDLADHYWTAARHARLLTDGRRCVRCSSTRSLEVNHKVPRNGAGYGTGCWNHQDLLETLCHDHHVKVTNTQRAGRAAAA